MYCTVLNAFCHCYPVLFCPYRTDTLTHKWHWVIKIKKTRFQNMQVEFKCDTLRKNNICVKLWFTCKKKKTLYVWIIFYSRKKMITWTYVHTNVSLFHYSYLGAHFTILYKTVGLLNSRDQLQNVTLSKDVINLRLGVVFYWQYTSPPCHQQLLKAWNILKPEYQSVIFGHKHS